MTIEYRNCVIPHGLSSMHNTHSYLKSVSIAHKTNHKITCNVTIFLTHSKLNYLCARGMVHWLHYVIRWIQTIAHWRLAIMNFGHFARLCRDGCNHYGTDNFKYSIVVRMCTIADTIGKLITSKDTIQTAKLNRQSMCTWHDCVACSWRMAMPAPYFIQWAPPNVSYPYEIGGCVYFVCPMARCYSPSTASDVLWCVCCARIHRSIMCLKLNIFVVHDADIECSFMQKMYTVSICIIFDALQILGIIHSVRILLRSFFSFIMITRGRRTYFTISDLSCPTLCMCGGIVGSWACVCVCCLLFSFGKHPEYIKINKLLLLLLPVRLCGVYINI